MSTPAPPRTPAAVHLSRQQLDELDALLQRMLALPVNRLEDDLFTGVETPAPARPTASTTGLATSDRLGWTSLPSEAQSRRASTVADPRPARTSEAAEETSGLGGVSFVPAGPAVAQPPLDPPPADEPGRPDEVAASVEHGASTILDREAPPPAYRIRLLLWANGSFDRATIPLGAPGRWLRGRWGRAVLGGIGLLLWALALAFVLAAWTGWTG
jgi:hypothetical protein